ncbi:glycosyl hydrolase [Echinicola jeungdonensis]|uniref:Glycosyl hydrolase n=1 Tax=Echinicola jeungdonensis TaxID=709343 RepID=A0ABV5J8C0_9BACT|nr:glycosyl hydrolase [Echinicola jeungdonensis]MDN3669490.1 glycosyl hydrolase [Echinicola jeungdonensis]
MNTNPKILFQLLLLFALGTIAGCSGSAKEKITQKGPLEWPEVTQEMKPWTRWWWHGSSVTKEDIKAALEEYKEAGLGGVEITPIYGVHGAEEQFIDFLSPKWMEMLEFTLKEAKRLGLGVDLANASGWPFGGPWVSEDLACKYMAYRTLEVGSGESVNLDMHYFQEPLLTTDSKLKPSIEDIESPISANKDMQKYAFKQVRYPKTLSPIAVTANKKGEKGFSEVLDLTDQVKNGQLEWTAPEGDWLIVALYQGDHGKMVERAGPGGEGNVIDHFSEMAINSYLGHFDQAFEGYDLSYLRYYFNDSYEVDDAYGSSNWTPALFDAFEELNGYDLKNYLPALIGHGKEETVNRVLYDYRMTVSELLLGKFTKKWQTWAEGQGKGIRNQAHGSPANVLDLYAACDVPEIEGYHFLNLKSAASAAHVTGKKLVSSESATWLNEHFQSDFGEVKTALDRLWLAGVNHVFYHGTAFSPEDAQWPGWLFYAATHFTPANSLWEDFDVFNRYVARIQSFMQAGEPSNDILLYYGIADYWSEKGRSMLRSFHTDEIFHAVSLGECGKYLSENGYSWDAISDNQLMDVKTEGSGLLAGGNHYQTILVPKMDLMPLETLEKLMELAENGASVLFLKNLPMDVPGLGDLDARKEKMKTLKAKISFVEKAGSKVAPLGKGEIVLAEGMEKLLLKAPVKAESMYEMGLACIKRKKDSGGHFYLIKNQGLKSIENWVSLKEKFASAAIFNPMTGKNGFAEIQNGEVGNELFLQIKPEETLIVETFGEELQGELYPYYEVSGEMIPIAGNWEIEFTKGGPSLPEKVPTTSLKSWTEFGKEYEAFSGTAEYKITLPVSTAQPAAWRLNLGEVKESASVYLNGEYVGTCFQSPFSLDIPGNLFKGNDELIIKVSNLMANRIADLDKRGVEWRIFYNTNFNARKRENVGKDGKFTAKNWEPQASGLLGPISLTPLEMESF